MRSQIREKIQEDLKGLMEPSARSGPSCQATICLISSILENSCHGEAKDIHYCRLDRAICNSEWSDLYPACRSQYLNFEGSNHRPLVSFLDPTRRKGNKIFRYDIRLRDNAEVSTTRNIGISSIENVLLYRFRRVSKNVVTAASIIDPLPIIAFFRVLS